MAARYQPITAPGLKAGVTVGRLAVLMFNLSKDIISLGYYTAMRVFNNAQNREAALLYHSLGTDNSQGGRYKLILEPRLFEEQVKFLASFNKENIIITFDDGFASFYDIAFPIILKYGIKTILFVSIGFIDGLLHSRVFNKNPNMAPLTWVEIRDISNAGIEIGSHTITHQNLLKISEKLAQAEIADSKKIIEDKIGREVKYFAYPYGGKNALDNRIKQVVKNSGYEKAYTNIMGFNTKDSDLYELSRIRIYSNDNMFRFKLKIKGAYNWIDFFNN